MSQRVIVTRPAHDAAVWVTNLNRHGLNAQALPLIEIAAVSDPADVSALKRALSCIGGYAACMFVSGNAVAHFFSHLFGSNGTVALVNANLTASEIIANPFSPSLRFLAPGPGTVAALLAAGVPSSQIDAPPIDAAQFDSEALWQVVGQHDWRGLNVLIVRGKGDAADTPAGTGRDWLMQQWRAQGSTVDVVSSYERCAPAFTDAQVALAHAASQDGSVWLFSSSEAVVNLTRQTGMRSVNWQRAQAIATHPRIQAVVRNAGWGDVHLSRPALTDIVAALASIESKSL